MDGGVAQPKLVTPLVPIPTSEFSIQSRKGFFNLSASAAQNRRKIGVLWASRYAEVCAPVVRFMQGEQAW